MKHMISIFFILALIAGCTSTKSDTEPSNRPSWSGMGGMMGRHHADIPDPYAGKTNPVPGDEASLERGGAVYAEHCASCHGDGGMGDGPAGTALSPAPAAVAHSSQMLGDAYLYWRISEGGVGFSTSMPAWKETLDETARWDVINYIQALGSGKVEPVSSMGGSPYDPAIESARQAEMLAKAIEQKVISQAEAEIFSRVHEAMEEFEKENPDFLSGSGATERQNAILEALVEEKVISQSDADAFVDIHDRLGVSGLMP